MASCTVEMRPRGNQQMSYLQKSLAPGETIVAVFRLHWSMWIRFWIVIVLGIIAVVARLIAQIAWGALAAAVLAVLIAGYHWLAAGHRTGRHQSPRRPQVRHRFARYHRTPLGLDRDGRPAAIVLGPRVRLRQRGNHRTGRNGDGAGPHRASDRSEARNRKRLFLAYRNARGWRNRMSEVTASGARAVLTDIEGTTSSIAFVKDVLFPYARARLPRFIENHQNDPEVLRWLDATAREAGIDDPRSRRVVDTLLRWIDEDRKATPLKALQGMIWKAGYQAGGYRAHVYPEVPA